jgi:hypothetical protein
VAELPPKSVIKLDCDMSESEIAAHRSLLKSFKERLSPIPISVSVAEFCAALPAPGDADRKRGRPQRAANLVANPQSCALLASSMRFGKREKVIVFARLRTMQGILAKVLEAEFSFRSGSSMERPNCERRLIAECIGPEDA